MEFLILGDLQASASTGQRLALGGPADHKVLTVLLLNAGRVVPVTVLVDALWDDDPPAGAVKQARNAVSRLRCALAAGGEPGVIVTEHGGYRLRLDGNTLDTRSVETAVTAAEAAAKAGDVARAAALLESALGLWRGRVLAGLSGRVIETAADAWDERRCGVLETYYAHRLALGEHHRVISDLHAMVAQYPLREGAAAQLMLALYRCGRRADALAVYTRTREVLAGELGLDPDSRLQSLHQQILTSDPRLELRAPGGRETSEDSTRQEHVVPRQLPAAPRNFTGRGDELRMLAEWLAETGAETPGSVVISLISGTAGVGKTALAVYWAHQCADRFPDGQLYVNLRGYDPDQPMSAGEAMAGFLSALGVPGQDIPPGEAERAARYRSLLAGRRLLLILDNAASAEQVRPLLPGTASCVVLVTSRNALAGLVARDGAERIDLDLLPPEDAIALLRSLLGARVDADPRAAGELSARCSRLPLGPAPRP